MEHNLPSQHVPQHNENLGLWAKQQVLRIEALSKNQVLCELQGIMGRRSYSWNCIDELLQTQFDKGNLKYTLAGGDTLFEWNNLCNEKQVWERKGCLSVNNAEFNKACLINLMILPVHAGLGVEGTRLVTANLDKPTPLLPDLGVGPKDFEGIEYHVASLLVGDTVWSSDSEDSDYDDESDNETIRGDGRKAITLRPKAANKDEQASDNGSGEEMTGDDSDLDEPDTEDEYSEDLDVRILDVDIEDEISDLEL